MIVENCENLTHLKDLEWFSGINKMVCVQLM